MRGSERERPVRLLTARVGERETGASARCEGQRERYRSVCSLRGSERERPERLLAARVGERETGASTRCEGQRERDRSAPGCLPSLAE
ncbi:hypothetical protein CgunFtcFv8_014700 [Champsocephalus gunnari]|uniref:Uncharacterized protein n=1 Tax=Champsocephalus gunnari TaxID=52237 RepID=A0AAN8E6K2_CHAGU|nr:hypothetical protein CgunFtcFv8_014700 [Champsocephalus gunnari]